MPNSLGCPGCGKRYDVDDRLAGKRAKCKACGREMVIPAVKARSGGSAVDPFADLDDMRSAGAATATAGASSPASVFHPHGIDEAVGAGPRFHLEAALDPPA